MKLKEKKWFMIYLPIYLRYLLAIVIIVYVHPVVGFMTLILMILTDIITLKDIKKGDKK